MTRTAVFAAAAALLAGCGSQTGTGSGAPTPSAPSSGEVLYTEATVLESPDHGPQLCLGGVMESLPPQCGGMELVGWDWQEAGGFERLRGTTWGSYVVIGRYDSEADTFTLSRPAVPAEEYDGPRLPVELDTPLGTPCEEPPGGWQVVDSATTDDAALGQAQRVAHRLPGFAGFWYDQSINPAYGSDDPAEQEQLMNDPEKLVVNVAVTTDVDEAEATLRQVWGGALCVSGAEHTQRELRRIQEELTELEEVLSVGTSTEGVHLTVVHDDGTLQKRLDSEYGAGVVEVGSALRPFPG